MESIHLSGLRDIKRLRKLLSIGSPYNCSIATG
jgi:hypothetical protein